MSFRTLCSARFVQLCAILLAAGSVHCSFAGSHSSSWLEILQHLLAVPAYQPPCTHLPGCQECDGGSSLLKLPSNSPLSKLSCQKCSPGYTLNLGTGACDCSPGFGSKLSAYPTAITGANKQQAQPHHPTTTKPSAAAALAFNGSQCTRCPDLHVTGTSSSLPLRDAVCYRCPEGQLHNPDRTKCEADTMPNIRKLLQGSSLATGSACTEDSQCSTGMCGASGTCSPESCSNGELDDDQGETDVDCGGDCPACHPYAACSSDADCGGNATCSDITN